MRKRVVKSVLFLVVIFSLFTVISCVDEEIPTKDDEQSVTDQEMVDEVVVDNEVVDETVVDEEADETVVDEEVDTEVSDEDSIVKNKIKLEVYSNGWGNLLDTLWMDEEGEVIIEVNEEEPYSGDTPEYFIYASRDGFYTEYYYCSFGDTINVDLDPIEESKFNGVFFMVQSYFGPTYLAGETVTINDKDGKVAEIITDDQGRFAVELENGDYTAVFSDMDGAYYNEGFKVDGNYHDFKVIAEVQAAKPNIYLYPEKKMDIEVKVGFPVGGRVIESIPEYGTGWNVNIEPDGKIDDKYTFLFYESMQPDLAQYKSGWVIKKKNLEAFFRVNLAETGFVGQEIEDFIEWWIPRLTDSELYAIYPQYNKELSGMVTLDFSVIPDNLIRLIYSVRPVKEDNLNISIPVIPEFSRSGFTVLEWGLILK